MRGWALACGAAAALAFAGIAGGQTNQTAGGGDIQPVFSPNGTQIAFARKVGAHYEIYVMKAGGGGFHALTHGAPDHSDPAWSPNGKQIAYSRDAHGYGATLGGQVFVVSAGGGGNHKLSSGTGGYDELLGWSPNGKQVLFERIQDGLGSVYVEPSTGGPQTRLTPQGTDAYLATFSPSGTQIAFARTAANAFGDIYVMNADGTGVKPIAHTPADETDPIWAPSGKQIAFMSDRTGHYEIWVASAAGGAARRLTHTPGGAQNPSWSPNGKELAFQEYLNDADGIGHWQIAEVNAAGGGQKTLTTGSVGDNTNPSWSPNSKQIAFASTRNNSSQIFVMSASGAGQHAVS